MSSSRVISLQELSEHNSEKSCWIAIDGEVFDVTKFMNLHPGGKQVILQVGGRNVTDEFYSFHRSEVLVKYREKLRVGVLDKLTDSKTVVDVYTPFAETPFLRGWKSAYCSDSVRQFRITLREFLNKTVKPQVEGLHESGQDPPDDLYGEVARMGVIACRVGKAAMPWFREDKLFGGISPKEFTHFHELATIQEVYSIGSSGVSDGLGVGATIGLPPVIYFGNSALKKRIVPEVLAGTRRICLAVTEPGAGSDVASIQTTAKLNKEGTHYIVNGVKKWITGGYVSDYYTTAVRTGEPGHKGISLLLIENPKSSDEGVITKHKIKTCYSAAAGTSLIVFENVLVPKENLLGKEGGGFKLIMANFNHERWYLSAVGSAGARTCVAECYKWAMQRKAFGKRLIDQPVIRYKLAEMTAMVECLEAWLEQITFQMDSMTPMEQFENLSPSISLLKFQMGRIGWQLADNAAQIFGGRAVTRTGMGRIIEMFKTETKLTAITGGSEEILADLAVRQVVSQCDKAKKSSQEAIVLSRL
jgi:alkylation response protein AidB-like acyl-CoA dehydrogenase/predicted heme/steroid binding protein